MTGQGVPLFRLFVNLAGLALFLWMGTDFREGPGCHDPLGLHRIDGGTAVSWFGKAGWIWLMFQVSSAVHLLGAVRAGVARRNWRPLPVAMIVAVAWCGAFLFDSMHRC